MVLAIAFETAARRKVARAPGSSRWECERSVRVKKEWRKKVIEGLSVRTRLAEYPDQKPARPFSPRMEWMISAILGSGEGSPARWEIIDAVCFLVTIFEIGVVNNLLQAPASAPTDSSSSAGRDFEPCFARRFSRR